MSLRHSIALAFLPLLAVTDLALAAPPPKAETADNCASQIYKSVSDGGVSAVPAYCWHIGPVALGMGRSAVEERLGSPDFEADSLNQPDQSHRYTTSFFVFPRDLAARLAKHPAREFAHRVLQVTYDDDMVVSIDNNPPEMLWSEPCRTDPKSEGISGERISHPPRDFAPFEKFAGVKVGDTLASVSHRLGRPSPNKSRDFYTYWPVPIRLGVDPDTATVTGFAISTDMKSAGSGMAHIFIMKDPKSCLNNGFKLMPKGPN
jgi:hypothetical protein